MQKLTMLVAPRPTLLELQFGYQTVADYSLRRIAFYLVGIACIAFIYMAYNQTSGMSNNHPLLQIIAQRSSALTK